MFAFAIFDQATAKLFLARDRTGIKPLYYYAGKEGFFFGSEPKALLQASVIPRQLNFKALADFFVLGYALAPATLFENIFELRPGAWIEIGQEGLQQGEYWRWFRQEMDWDEPESLQQIEHALIKSLQEHLVSDVPIGAFLSGGIDSSLLTALLGRVLGVKLDTFNVKFGESEYDESLSARMVANHLGTRHHEINLHTGTSDLTLVSSILDQFDQPFGDTFGDSHLSDQPRDQ
jgi:asparagine synthase (glutamine-hydrolysing)